MENKLQNIRTLLKENEYPGRGIIAGLSDDGKKAVFAYFIMGRSENSQNRIFVESEDGIRTKAYDESKMTDPSLIIYAPVRKLEDQIIVSNGDQTDTIYDFLSRGESFEAALATREFEPDEPNFTPRISALLDLSGDYSYKLSILKRGENGECLREYFPYEPEEGIGHFIHTYDGNGDPLPSFSGAPHKITIDGSIDDLTRLLWDSMNNFNKVSLYVRFTYLKNGLKVDRFMNKNK